ncbi:hypothetical protein [Parafrankia sp. EUN1f]|uniref:hypothetical protein n=1 Tax=Parafrankia sp. EUN1f TaxID=102897 RepID=UPI0001C46466|nr:hypothetical protein [Parafrankia sp. EUN1f]EFC80902.1 hypothetical protein FrEUN1fDRAFT_6004 [Parafrankia sp. EUN1f]
MSDRRNPPPGYTVKNEGDAGWCARNPAGDVIAIGWASPAAAVHQAWEAADAIARADRDRQPGWFALSGDRILGGPYDHQAAAAERLDRYVDNGTFRTAYGRRTETWTFEPMPAPAEETSEGERPCAVCGEGTPVNEQAPDPPAGGVWCRSCAYDSRTEAEETSRA